MPIFHAIAAMSENRVIGDRGHLPWRLGEDFRWFKYKTMGGTLIMGRKTFESIGKPLPGRETIVLSRQPSISNRPKTESPLSLGNYVVANPARTYWVCGGAQIYAQLLARCDSLYLTRVGGEFEGDAKMPNFENLFLYSQTIHRNERFEIQHWQRNDLGLPDFEPWPDLSIRTSSDGLSAVAPGKVTYCIFDPEDLRQ